MFPIRFWTCAALLLLPALLVRRGPITTNLRTRANAAAGHAQEAIVNGTGRKSLIVKPRDDPQDIKNFFRDVKARNSEKDEDPEEDQIVYAEITKSNKDKVRSGHVVGCDFVLTSKSTRGTGLVFKAVWEPGSPDLFLSVHWSASIRQIKFWSILESTTDVTSIEFTKD